MLVEMEVVADDKTHAITSALGTYYVVQDIQFLDEERKFVRIYGKDVEGRAYCVRRSTRVHVKKWNSQDATWHDLEGR